MDDREYIKCLKIFRELKLDKDKWHQLDDRQRYDILEKMREVSEYSSRFRKNKKLKKLERYKEIDPYVEENWEDD